MPASSPTKSTAKVITTQQQRSTNAADPEFDPEFDPETEEISDPRNMAEAGVEITCPCFDSEDLGRAIQDITGPDAVRYNFQSDTSCTGDNTTAIAYSEMISGQFMQAMGYGVSGDFNECIEQDAIRMITAEEATYCKNLIEEKCAEHEVALTAAANSNTVKAAGEGDIQCPCFTKEDVDALIAKVTNGDIILNTNSCAVVGSSGKTISYNENEGESEPFPAYISFGTYSFMAEYNCLRDDTVQTVSKEEMDNCAALVDTACVQLGL